MPENSNQNQVNSENEKSESKKSIFSVIPAIIKAIVGLVKMIPQGLSPQEQGVLFILILVSILLLSFGLYLGASGEPIYCLIAFIVTLLLFFYAMYFIINSKQKARDKLLEEDMTKLSKENESEREEILREEEKAEQTLQQKGIIVWKREVLKLPLPEDNRSDITQELENIRNAALSWLNEEHPDLHLQKQLIRVNIFLAHYQSAGKGAVCVLRIPEYFRCIGMEGHPDEGITFRPGEGATGKAFAESKDTVKPVGESARKWEELYTLTGYQKRTLHKDLSWIITYPLKNKSGKAMAVLNVDFLGLVSDENELYHLKGELEPWVNKIEDMLNENDKVLISINVEPVSKS